MPKRGVQARKEYVRESSKLKYVYKQARASGMDVDALTGVLSRLIDVRNSNWVAGINPYMGLYEHEEIKAILVRVPRTIRGLYRSLIFFSAKLFERGVPPANVRADTESLAKTWGLDPAIAGELAEVVVKVFPGLRVPPEVI